MNRKLSYYDLEYHPLSIGQRLRSLAVDLVDSQRGFQYKSDLERQYVAYYTQSAANILIACYNSLSESERQYVP